MPEDGLPLRNMVRPAGRSAGRAYNEISQALDEWIEAVNGRAVDAVGALYMPGAVLLSTFAPQPLASAAERRDYFVNFLARKNLKASVDECHITTLGDDAGEASGLYTFRFEDESGAPQSVKARFTFVYARQPEGDWLIAAHHSSMVPANGNATAV